MNLDIVRAAPGRRFSLQVLGNGSTEKKQRGGSRNACLTPMRLPLYSKGGLAGPCLVIRRIGRAGAL